MFNLINQPFSQKCPHCQHFAPNYIKFARRMKEKILKPYGVEMEFYAVSCVANRDVCHKQDIHGYPTMKIFPPESSNGTVVKYFDLHPFQVLRAIGIEVYPIDGDELDKDGEDMDSGKKKYTLKKANAFLRTKTDIYNDAYRSFHFAMKTGVFMQEGPLEDKIATVLRNWLQLLQDTLPPTWSIHILIHDLLENFDDIVKGEDEMMKILDKYPPSSNEWSKACTKGVEAMGYTCGLWELFHVMTLGVVEYNKNVVTDDGYAFHRTEQAADILRDYIANFFGCEVCRMNFLQSYDACAFDRCNRLQDKIGELKDWKQLPLWLFETHNAVNVRLMKEEAEREERTPTHQDELNAQWPSRLDCPKCWHPDGSWDEDLMYEYLRHEYWPDNGDQGSKRKLFQPVIRARPEDMDDEESFLTSVFKFGPFMVLAAIIFYLYTKRLKMWKTGYHKKTDM